MYIGKTNTTQDQNDQSTNERHHSRVIEQIVCLQGPKEKHYQNC